MKKLRPRLVVPLVVVTAITWVFRVPLRTGLALLVVRLAGILSTNRIMEARMKCVLRTGSSRSASALVMLTIFAGGLRAGVNDLRITEVRPATGQVEVTHIGATAFTTTSTLPFCHRFNYVSVIPSNTTFGPGESKVFVLAGLNSSDSDVWLYRDGNFASAASIITGMKYGPTANVGRTALAASVGLWPSASAFVPAPAAGQSLQPVTIEATRTTNWFSGTPNFGSFSPVQIHITRLTDADSSFTLEFSSPLSADFHRLEARPTLSPDSTWAESSLTVSNSAPGQFQILIPKSTNTSEYFRIKRLL